MRAGRTPLDELSKRVFNSEHRLRFTEYLSASTTLLTINETALATGIAPSTVHSELHLLADIGALQRIQVGRSVSFQKVDGPFWAWCEELRGHAGATSRAVPGVTREPV